MPLRFPIAFDAAYAILSRSLFVSPADSYVEVDGDQVSARMGWAFRARFDRSTVAAVTPAPPVRLTRGVHGWAGRWLVNGAGDGLLTLELAPKQRAYVMGFPVGLRQLVVSLESPTALREALRGERA